MLLEEAYLKSCFFYKLRFFSVSLLPWHSSFNLTFFLFVFVSPAKQKRDICTAFPASLSSSAAA